MSESFFGRQDAAFEAIDDMMPAIQANMQKLDKTGLHIVFLDPLAVWTPTASFDTAILAEKSIGKSSWDQNYDVYALDKARLSWQHNKPSRQVIEDEPELLKEGDVLFAGSAVLGKIVVAISGLPSALDEAFSLAIAAMYRGNIKVDLKEFRSTGDHTHLPKG